ncbi:sensor histidine kinase [Microvirga massiliensis]|uniref:sensor histidine kinase n=1 Tax=Microvirga massiliensis TaxID=1033741 RepID=UPI00164E4103|nr:sensor histidine kinase [Microvirga massiliensis]
MRYSGAAFFVAAAALLKLALSPRLDGYVFLLFFPAVIASAALFNRGSGFVAIALSSLAAAAFIEPHWSLWVGRGNDLFALALFVATTLATTTLIEALHDALHQLARAEQEKDLLLREAGHRFRNDLTTMSALLRLQERAIPDAQAQAAFAAATDRIHVLGRAQEKLERVEGAAIVRTDEFITDLCDDLRLALLSLRPITLTVEVERHPLPQERAAAVGLIINEWLTNALKYAFPEERSGQVTVSFARREGEFILEVSDDGIGFDPHQEPQGSGLGQRLVSAMARQLGGAVKVGPRPDGCGTRAMVKFPAKARR